MLYHPTVAIINCKPWEYVFKAFRQNCFTVVDTVVDITQIGQNSIYFYVRICVFKLPQYAPCRCIKIPVITNIKGVDIVFFYKWNDNIQ